MAYATINKPSDYFNTKLYTGNGGTLNVTGVGFQPDWVWIKSRVAAHNHHLTDSVRGINSTLFSNTTGAEDTGTDKLQSFNSDGFTVGSSGSINSNTDNYASWNWLAGGTASSNTDGSITSTVSANTTAGFSIVKFTGTGSTATVGHGLGAAPDWYLVKRYNGGSGGQWNAYHSSLGATKYMLLNSTSASGTSATRWNNTEPTSSVFTVNTSGDVNDSGDLHIVYCFAEIKGYSKFGSYTGNGDANGPFIYTGFRPTFIIFKRTDGAGAWQIHDRTRETINDGSSPALKADGTDAEFSKNVDFLSNGIKIRDTSSDINGASGQTYIYMAFAEAPLVGTNNIPATAR